MRPLERLFTAQSSSCRKNTEHRSLRCEPLEDRRMLSVLFVDDNAAAGGDGLAWSSAFNDLQAAIDQTSVLNADGDHHNDIDAIWIAEGVYRPSAELEPGDTRSATFSLPEGVALYGGFEGTETTLEDRNADPLAHETILSGDLGVEGDVSDNARTVVYCGETVVSAIDGVTVTGGNADQEDYTREHQERRRGGGVYSLGEITITNSTISDNFAWSSGGGIFAGGSGMTLTGSTIRDNVSQFRGGGLSSATDSLISNSTFAGNTASAGSAIENEGTLAIRDSRIVDNDAISSRGAIFSGNFLPTTDTLTISNSLIARNTAAGGNAGICIYGWMELTVTNSTITDNTSSGSGGGIYSYGPMIINNSIVWSNDEGEIGGEWNLIGSNNLIGVDPQFIDPAVGDYRLSEYSPAIDAGDTSLVDGSRESEGFPLIETDLNGNPRVYGDAVDIGAFEYEGDVAPGRETPSTVVTTDADVLDLYDGEISLREAIYYAADDPSTTVTFDTSLDGASITLGGTPLVVDKSLTIDASALESLTVDADGKSNVVIIAEGDGREVTLAGLTLTGGDGHFGAGILNRAALTLADSIVSNNEAWVGGGVYNTGTLTVVDSTILQNRASEDGGGIYSEDGIVEITGSVISENAAGRDGGGISNDSGTLSISNSTVSKNDVYGYSSPGSGAGGGIYNTGELSVVGCSILENTITYHSEYSSNRGAGLANLGTADVSNTLVADNLAIGYGLYGGNIGGGIYNNDTLRVVNATIAGNGPGAVHNDADLTLVNSILLTSYGDEVTGDGTVVESNNLIGTDPEFIDASGGDYRLQDISPAVNAGDNSYVDGTRASEGYPLIETDLDGKDRISGGTVDIGAYEYHLPVNILFVDDDAAAGGDGSSWASAFDDLQAALDAAADRLVDDFDGNDIDEIWIAEGTYMPSAELEPGDARSATFSLLRGLTLYGGFEGTETRLGERNADLLIHETILSGDLGVEGDVSDNARTVVYCGETIVSAIDGVTVTGGNADQENFTHEYKERRQGGGVYSAGDMTIANSTIRDNFAWAYGGGIYATGIGLTITESTICDNVSQFSGGGLFSRVESTISGSTISGNASGSSGGGIEAERSLTIRDSRIVDNQTDILGGGIYAGFYDDIPSTVTVSNSLIARNTVEGSGAGIYIYNPHDWWELIVTNSTVTDNTSTSGGGGIYSRNPIVINNSIVWSNDEGEIGGDWDVTGANNLIGVDPRFVDPVAGDYRLSGYSPGIDAGDTTFVDGSRASEGYPLIETDLDGNSRVYGDAVDIGAFEYEGDVAPGRETPSTIVTTSADTLDLYDGEISLREAIYYAADDPSTTVTFDASLNDASIVLGGTPLVVDRSLTIDASALDSLAVDADGKGSVMTIPEAEGREVAIVGLALIGGDAYQGGGVVNRATLTLTDSIVSSCEASVGGGISNAGDLTLVDSVICNNKAAREGGGIYNEGTVHITGSSVSQNVAGAVGGGISNDSGTLAITDSEISENAVVGYSSPGAGLGGGIWNDGTLSVLDCMITENKITYPSEYGSNRGAGLANVGTADVSNTVIARNRSTGMGLDGGNRGGGIYNNNTLRVVNSTVTDNTVRWTVGEVDNDGALTLVNTIVWSGGAGGEIVGDGTVDKVSSLIGSNPGCVDWSGGDYRLRKASPAVDSGDNSYVDGSRTADGYPLIETDLDGSHRIYNGTVDIGAYEFHFGDGDLNADGVVNSKDLDIVRSNWGASVLPGIIALGDPSGDGIVGGDDLDIVRANWQTETPIAASAEEEAADPVPTVVAPSGNRLPSPSATDVALVAAVAERPSPGLSDADLATLAEVAWMRELEGRKARRAVPMQ